MIAERKKTKSGGFQDVLVSFLIIILIFGVAGFLIFSDYRLKKRRDDLTVKLQSLQEEIKTLEDKNADLKSNIDKTATEDFQKEKLYEQGYVDKGANQVVVVPPENSPQPSAPAEKSFWQKLWEKIKF